MKTHKNSKVIIIFVVIIVILLCIASFFLGAKVMNRSGNNSDTNDNSPTPEVTQEATDTPNPTSSPTPTVAATLTPEPTDSAATNGNNVIYKNTQYGFDFTLPASFEGYRILTDSWQGTAVSGKQQGQMTETGVNIIIRHPQWTKENPRQDIPIMVFTKDQWKKVEKETLSVSAAPVIPSKLGSNSKYVFAIPARYNFGYLTGYEEVDKIVNGNALVPNENFEEK